MERCGERSRGCRRRRGCGRASRGWCGSNPLIEVGDVAGEGEGEDGSGRMADGVARLEYIVRRERLWQQFAMLRLSPS